MARQVICIRADETEKRLMERAAGAADLALATWSRTVLLRVARETLAAARDAAAASREARRAGGGA